MTSRWEHKDAKILNLRGQYKLRAEKRFSTATNYFTSLAGISSTIEYVDMMRTSTSDDNQNFLSIFLK